MARFSYVARNGQGVEIRGEQDGADSASVADSLLRRALIPVTIQLKVQQSEGIQWASLFQRKLPLEELVVFARQMYSLTKAGVPLLGSIAGLAGASHSELMKATLMDLQQQLESGRTLSTAMAGHPKVFGRLFISMVHVGENTGQLEESFLQLVQYLEKEQETRRRLKSAVRYPSFVLLAIGIALTLMNTLVIPKFAEMFSHFNAELPWATRVLIAMSNLFVYHWYWLLLGLASLFFGVRYYLKTEKGRYNWDKRKLNLPIVGSIINRSTLERFSRSFAIMLKAGIPINQALTLVAGAVDNSFVASKVAEMRREIERGDTLLRCSRRSELFTPLVLQMIAVGDETGRVDELLMEAADYYEREVDYDLKTLTARIEPLLISCVAVMVLILALGIFTPMWDMMRAVRGGG